jgi:P-type Cu+ transporter
MTKLIDPVCGMAVDPRTAAAHGSYGGQVVYFCSSACQQKFERAGSPRPT